MNNDDRIILYFHEGSFNHGCEAIIRSIVQIFKDYNVQLFSSHPQHDIQYGLDQALKISASGEQN